MADKDPNLLLALRRAIARAIDRDMERAVGTVFKSTGDAIGIVFRGVAVIGLMWLAHAVTGVAWYQLFLGGSGGLGIGLLARHFHDRKRQPPSVA